MKILFKCLLALFLYFSVEQLTRTQTDGFRLEKTMFDSTASPKWEVRQSQEPLIALDQPFHFLGSGAQFYAFLSEDRQTVLKVFKHYHLFPSARMLKKLPLPKKLVPWKSALLEKRKTRIEMIYASTLIAHNNLPEETGTIYLNINPKANQYPKIKIFDKIGVSHTLDLNTTPFLLQKHADLIFPYLDKHPERTEKILASLFRCIENRENLRIANTDPALFKNFGVINDEVVEIDIGSFTASSNTPIHEETKIILSWIKKHQPRYLHYLQNKKTDV